MTSNPSYNQYGGPGQQQQQPPNAWPPGYTGAYPPQQPGYPPPGNTAAAYPPPQVGYYPPPIPAQAPPSYEETAKDTEYAEDPYGGQVFSFSDKSIRMGKIE